MVNKLQPVSINGIEFDALVSKDESYQQEIPDYPTEEGFSVSDTIILKPITLNMVLYISNTPVTWAARHGISTARVSTVKSKLEELYFSRSLVKVVTNDAIYTDMGMVSMQISQGQGLSNSRQVTLSLKKVYVTKRKTVYIPPYLLKSGDTGANAGKAVTSSSASSQSQNDGSESKKAGSILFGAASSIGLFSGGG